MTDDEKVLLVCAPFSSLHTSTSVLITATCGDEVWLSVSGQKLLKENEHVVTACHVCAVSGAMGVKIMEEENKAAPGALDEVEGILGPATRRMLEGILEEHNASVRKGKKDA